MEGSYEHSNKPSYSIKTNKSFVQLGDSVIWCTSLFHVNSASTTQSQENNLTVEQCCPNTDAEYFTKKNPFTTMPLYCDFTCHANLRIFRHTMPIRLQFYLDLGLPNLQLHQFSTHYIYVQNF
jgi:hypothetical protein